jgi:hypothetical protein
VLDACLWLYAGDKLSPAEKIIAACGVALAIVSFFPWFGLAGGTRNAWKNPLSSFAVLVGIVMVAQILLSRFTTTKLPAPPVPWGRVHLILGVLALVLALLQFVVGDEVTARVADVRVSVELDREFGLFLGVLAAAGLAYGGFRRSKEPEVTPGFMA